MTRETKVGLIVAGSFVCLVAVVVAAKWNNGDPASNEPEEQAVQVAAVKPGQTASPADEKKTEEPKKVEPVKVTIPSPLSANENKPNAGVKLIEGFDVNKQTPLQLPPAVLPPLDKVQQQLVEQKEILAQNQTPQFPALPKPGAGPETANPGLPVFPPLENKPISIPPPISQPVVEEKKPSQVETLGAVQLPPLKSVPPIEDKKTGSVVIQVPPPVLPIEEKKTTPGPIPILPPAPPTEVVNKPGQSVPAFPPLTTPNPPTKEVTPQAPPITITKDTQKPTITPLPNDRPLVPTPVIGSENLQSTPTINLTPGGGNSSLPLVKDSSSGYAEARQGESTFALLSQRLYGSEKYADALLVYNRKHSAAIKNGSALLSNPPIVSAGQQVLHPPKESLESAYASLIRDTIPTIPTAQPVNLAKPSPLTTEIAKVSNPPTVSPGGKYVVQNPAGESILDIAERTLGNRSRWHEIYRINPTHQPQFRIPAGTELKLPGN